MKKRSQTRSTRDLSPAWIVPLLFVAACGSGGGSDSPSAAAPAVEAGTAAEATASADPIATADTDAAVDIAQSDVVDATQVNDDEIAERIAAGELPADASGGNAPIAAAAPESGEDSPWLATRAPLAVTGSGYTVTSAEAKRLYGPGLYVMDGLWNMNAQRAKGYDTVVSYRFRAPYSGSLSSVRLYWSDGSGYAGGNGGDISLRVLPDDGSARHLPDWNASPLASGRRTPGSLSMSGGRYSTSAHRFQADNLSSSRSLEAGKLYHLVVVNNASNPSSNWSSVNAAYTVNANGHPSRWMSRQDYAALLGRRTAGSSAKPTWEDWTVDGRGGARIVPIMEMKMSDGRAFGQTNMETGNHDSGGRIWKNGSGNPIRERYVPNTTRAVSGLSIQTAKVSGSGNLRWQIMQGSREIASGTISQGNANYWVDRSLGSTGVLTWYDVSMPTTTLSANQTYDVVLTPQGSSVWAFVDQRNGNSYGFGAPPAFTESQAQTYTSGRWLDANHWSKNSSSRGSNWRILLHAN